jgi:hypothetical protein
VASGQSLGFRAKKVLNDVLRRLTGYQFVKVQKLDQLEAVARKTARPREA